MYYPVKTPRILKWLFPKLIWHIAPMGSKKVYLTFDDGPNPGITDWVLEQLEKFNAKATFFCQGNRIEENPGFIDRIRSAGHMPGNHTYSHLNGWRTDDDRYFEDVERCRKLLKTPYFRPPYGKISRSQIKRLIREFKIIMWDVVSWDFDRSLAPERCLKNVLDHTVAGSIVVFHDSPGAFPRLRYTLPRTLEALSERGFRFEAIDI